jgi:hypothetical protein
MATNRGRSPTIKAQTRPLDKNKLTNSTTFRIQSAPPLSLQHYLRSASGVLPGAKRWQTSGKYRPPIHRAYLSPDVRQKPKPHEPVWHPPGRYKEKPITSLSPERKVVAHVKEPVWHHPGKFEHTPVPHFDAPSLRWSLQDLLRSMPEMRPKPLRASSSMSALRKSAETPLKNKSNK